MFLLLSGKPPTQDAAAIAETARGLFQRRDSERSRQYGVPCRHQTGTAPDSSCYINLFCCCFKMICWLTLQFDLMIAVLVHNCRD